MIPKEWDIQPLSEIATVTSGGTPSRTKPEYWQNGTVPWIRTTEVQNCVLNPEDVKEYISEQGLKNSSAKLVPAGTILLAMIGQGKTRGQVALLKFEASTNQNAATIVFNKDQEPEFHFNFLLSQYENIRGMSNSAGQSNLSGALVKAIKVPVPPLPEQKKIAQILSTWDKAITTTEQLLANSQQQKKALMQQLLTGKKCLLDKNGVRFSGGWKWSKIQEVGMVVTGSTPPKSDENNYGGDVLWATAEDFAGKYVSDTKIKLSDKGSTKARIVPKGSVLVTCIASIGKNAIANEDMGTNQQINAVVVSDSFSNEFFYYQIEFNVNKLISIAGVTAVPIVNKSSFQQVKLIFPVLEEQQKIAAVLSTADQEISALQQKLDAFKQEKKALMQQLLTGKRRVKLN